MRGRAAFGKDNMGGSAANRITNANCGITGTTLGAVGGSQLLHQHTHTVTDSGHTHGPAAGQITQFQAGGGSGLQGTADNNFSFSNLTGSSVTGISIDNSGTGSSQNVPPAIILNYIIKT